MKKKFLKVLCLSMMMVSTFQVGGYCEKVYSDKELVELATVHYKLDHNYIPERVEIDREDGDEVVIYLYEAGNFTSDWYTVNRKTGKGKDFFGNEIDILLRTRNQNLFLAVENSDLEKIRVLIENGADVNAKNKRGFTPLHYAKNADIAKVLIENGADVNAKDRWVDTPLHLVNDVEIAKVLIANGADVNAKNKRDGETPLHRVNDVEIARLLIENGADVNAKSDDGYTPLHFVEDVEIAKLLIANGADVNAKSDCGITPLHWIDDVEIERLLVENGADVNAKDDDRSTPIDIARERGNKDDIVQLLS